MLIDIKPGAFEWDDRSCDGGDAVRLSLEQVVRLRQMLRVEQTSLGMPYPEIRRRTNTGATLV